LPNVDPVSPFVRDPADSADMTYQTLVLVMTRGIGTNLTNDEKRAHLSDLRREHMIEQVCLVEILPPEK
jgi:hypothetical protein